MTVLYHTDGSAPCRAVRMLAKEIGVELELRSLDLFAGDNMKPEFLEINPQHTVPTIVEDDFVLTESRAIMTYLMNKHAPESSLYPQEPRDRAQVEKYLYYDMGVLYKSVLDLFLAPLFGRPCPEDAEERLKSVLVFLEEHVLGDKEYITGENFTIADICIGATLTCLEAFEFGFPDAPRLEKYYTEKIKALPYFDEINGPGIELLKSIKSTEEATPEEEQEGGAADEEAGENTAEADANE
ncbi:glutathione S-transferase 1-1 [Galendromus occidentalis]|uniref:Glutathione S-transferase 1-1 n=1 Tax=Galendromus occidentalis TaxID=34638 RepID=A0AAJ6QNS9_9ACAR|nr:glutathione S-transferase 1-1 [Galendromus occidentalis]